MPDDSEQDAQVTVRLPAPMLEQIRQLAREDQRTVSQMVRLLLGRELERMTKETPKK